MAGCVRVHFRIAPHGDMHGLTINNFVTMSARLNDAGHFDFGLFRNSSVADESDGVSSGAATSIVVDDARLLFSGDYARHGTDLVLSKDGHDHVISDYFKGAQRKALSSPDGAMLSPDLVKALVGEVQVAQAGGVAAGSAEVIGTVSKLTGSATAIRNGVSVTLNIGDQVQKGDVVQAGADSSLNLTFIDGTVFGLSANARMVLNEMVYDPQGSANSSLLSLIQGTITFVAGETAHNGNMRVDTPVATMGIRGTAVLVEIGFEVPGQGGAPVKFQVLVEPNGRTGSYVLYNKNTGAIMGTVNQAGQVTSVTGGGDLLIGTAEPLSSTAQSIIQQTLQQYFPNYVPNANPRSNGSGGGSSPADPNSGTSPDPLKFTPSPESFPGQPFQVPINLPGSDINAPPVNVTITRFNSAPTVTVASVVVLLPQDKTSFDIGKQVTIADPDAGDVATPYVPGSARIVSATGPSGTPSSFDLKSLLTIDPQTGAVSYNPAAFKFLAVGQKAVYVIAFDSQSGPDTTHQTLTFTVDGSNDAPVIDVAHTTHSAAAGIGGSGVTAQGQIAFKDDDLGDGHTSSVTANSSNVGSLALGLAVDTGGLGSNGSIAWAYNADPSAVIAKLIASANGTFTETFTVTISDGHGGTVTQTVDITVQANVWQGGGTEGFRTSFSSEVNSVNDWGDPGNWSLGTPPDGSQFVLFNESATINLDVNANIGALLVGAGTYLVLTTSGGAHALNVAQELVNYGEVTLAPGVTLHVSNAIHNYGQLTIDHPTAGSTLLIDGNVVLDGGGTVTLDGMADRITGVNDASKLTNVDNKIDGYGKIGDGHMTLLNAAGGIIAATDFWHGITINTGHGTFTNDGLIVSASLFGGLEITGDITNNGTLEAQRGFLKVDGDVSGTGHSVIAGGILEFGGASNSHVLFSGNTADLLILNDPWHFTGAVTGFSFGDSIDIAGVSWRNVHLVENEGGSIDVTFGNASFKIDGDYDASHFLVTTDFHGGTVITWLDQAPQVATNHLNIGQEGSSINVSGLSAFDDDAGCRETYAYRITAGDDMLASGNGRLSAINDKLADGFIYDAKPGETVGKVAVTVTDGHGASDTVNFIFGTSATATALTGTAGKDVIIASNHSDTLTGGASADQFVFQTKLGQHVITDFAAGQDKIELDFAPGGNHAFAHWLSSHAIQQGADTLIAFGQGEADGSLLLKHVDLAQLKTSDFIHNGSNSGPFLA
jgi:VCBS repeat-containing protein